MPRVLHVVVTDAFAGVERHVTTLAAETARRGWEVTVVGGDPARMPSELGPGICWRPGGRPAQAVAAVARAGRQDVCHVHMTWAEAVGVATRPAHRGLLVATRHFAAPRGGSRLGGLLAPGIARRLDQEIAVSSFAAGRLEPPSRGVLRTVVRAGVPEAPSLWRRDHRVALVLQRLEAEKDTVTAVRAWGRAGLATGGWRLRVVGDGAGRGPLEALVRRERIPGVEFTGRSRDVTAEFAAAGLLLAPAPAESFGLSVVEAMAAGVPVVAAAGGGHLETVGQVPAAALFPPGDAAAAARALRTLAGDDDARAELSVAVRAWHRANATPAGAVTAVLAQYAAGAPGVAGGAT